MEQFERVISENSDLKNDPQNRQVLANFLAKLPPRQFNIGELANIAEGYGFADEKTTVDLIRDFYLNEDAHFGDRFDFETGRFKEPQRQIEIKQRFDVWLSLAASGNDSAGLKAAMIYEKGSPELRKVLIEDERLLKNKQLRLFFLDHVNLSSDTPKFNQMVYEAAESMDFGTQSSALINLARSDIDMHKYLDGLLLHWPTLYAEPKMAHALALQWDLIVNRSQELRKKWLKRQSIPLSREEVAVLHAIDQIAPLANQVIEENLRADNSDLAPFARLLNLEAARPASWESRATDKLCAAIRQASQSPNNLKALISQLDDSLLEQPALRRTLGDLFNDRMKRHWDLHFMVDKMAKLKGKLLPISGHSQESFLFEFLAIQAWMDGPEPLNNEDFENFWPFIERALSQSENFHLEAVYDILAKPKLVNRQGAKQAIRSRLPDLFRALPASLLGLKEFELLLANYGTGTGNELNADLHQSFIQTFTRFLKVKNLPAAMTKALFEHSPPFSFTLQELKGMADLDGKVGEFTSFEEMAGLVELAIKMQPEIRGQFFLALVDSMENQRYYQAALGHIFFRQVNGEGEFDTLKQFLRRLDDSSKTEFLQNFHTDDTPRSDLNAYRALIRELKPTGANPSCGGNVMNFDL